MNQIVLKIKSKKLMQKNEVCILLPEIPAKSNPETFGVQQKKYPVLWLLHGGTCDFDDYLQREHVMDLLQGKEVIAVIPNGLNSDFANHMEFGTGYAFTDYFFEELMPYIYASLPVSSKPEDNYLAGFSMGGAAALMFGLYRPEKFSKIGVLGSSVRRSDFLEEYRTLTGEAFRRLALEEPARFPTEFGDPQAGITRKEINMIARYPKVQDYIDSMECTWNRFMECAGQNRLPEILFCCGKKDMCYPKVIDFKKTADTVAAGRVSYSFLPGYGHDRADVTIMECIGYFGL